MPPLEKVKCLYIVGIHIVESGGKMVGEQNFFDPISEKMY